jgi:hypothetical protein
MAALARPGVSAATSRQVVDNLAAEAFIDERVGSLRHERADGIASFH